MNLPTKILFGSEAWKIEYLYTADGRKVRKSAPYLNSSVDGGIGAMVMNYLGGFHYQDGILRFFPTAEGYVDVTKNKIGYSYSYVFNHKDHLGNIRLSYAENPQAAGTLKVLEESHYYPFGFKHEHYSSNLLVFREKGAGPELMLTASPLNPIPQFPYNYKYNGKEFQNEMGLDWYDYGARNYDPALGRWMNIDPLAEKRYENNPYMYANNNPTIFIDPDGRCPVCVFVIAALLISQSAEAPTGNIQRDNQSRNATAGNNTLISGIILGSSGVGSIISNGSKANTIRQTIEKSREKTNETKKVPNPNGKKGGPAHQKKMESEEAKMKDEGFKTKREVMVNTPNGEKTKRFIDLEGINKKTGEIRQIQVGRQNKNGTPVAREKRALDDIEAETGRRPTFVPYN
ncbi:RHS repeat domain-containing protein [Flavobacterium microcysteis]|uniref:RHS repeat-associated core domain-containing protein n=1 Tax=Flavobacterium microcysteis TaxID=2596891 RepID=A0A501QNQ1_9FLAO|nr:RHS repeat-associated core domain-containing protein [Flavobacterium microcysteis]TPD73746.1 RHS repeat-associated core domain-containing protein [Flavobacterium microcysteis]